MIRNLDTRSGTICYEFKRTKKQKIIAKIAKDGKIIVYAPNYVSIDSVEKFIEIRAEWIIEKSNNAKQEYLSLQNSELDNIFIFGKSYPIVKVNNDKVEVKFLNDTIYLLGKKEQALSLLHSKLTRLAEKYLKERFFEIKKSVCEHKEINVQVKNVKSWWGCYYPKQKLIKLSLRLITRDKECIDAVIYHEFAHINELNHQEGFYNKLLAMYPNYYIDKRKLKDSKYNVTDNFIFGNKNA